MAKTSPRAKKPGAAKTSGAKNVKKNPQPVKATYITASPKSKAAAAAAAAKAPAKSAKKSAKAVVPVKAETPAPAALAKKSSVLGAKDLAHFREILLAKRRELLGDVRHMETEALRGGGSSNLSNLPIHMADMGSDNYEQEFTLGLVEKDRNLLRDINVALQKIVDGTYGICEGTGMPISKARLEAQPWARFSIEQARSMEKGMSRPSIRLQD